MIEIHEFSNGELKKTSNFPISLTPDTACIEFISAQVSVELFHGEKVILIDNENLKIPDSSTNTR